LSAAPQLLLWVRASIEHPAKMPDLRPVRLSPSSTASEPARNRPRPVSPELAFYRKYTEGMLRRYVTMSMEAGRVPSLLGKEMFRGKVTNYQVQGFDDVVIFIHDIEACIRKLDDDQQWLIRRIALQQYTQQEASHMLGLKRQTIIRRYNDAMNRLTGILLEVKLLEPFIACQDSRSRSRQNSCQGGKVDE
jgi:predicted DNA-binding protein (UPF0251 family)